MISHEEIRDAVSSYALGAVSQSDARATREHLRTCSECAAEYDRLRPAVTALAYSAEACTSAATGAALASPLLKARIMKTIRAESRDPAGRAIAYGVTAAALTIALLCGAYAASLYRAVARDRSLIAAQSTALATLLAPASRRVAFSGGEVFISKGKLYIATRLPAPPNGRVYQVWTLAKGSRTVAPSITFAPMGAGVAIVALPGDPATLSAVAISIEPAGGSKQPTSKPIAFVHLT